MNERCERCGRMYGVWFAPSDVWNDVMRGGDRGAADEFGFCCPTCFVELAEQRGRAGTGFLLTPFAGGPVDRASQVQMDGALTRRVAELEGCDCVYVEMSSFSCPKCGRPRTITREHFKDICRAAARAGEVARAAQAARDAAAAFASLDGPELRHWLGSQEVVGDALQVKLAHAVHGALRANGAE